MLTTAQINQIIQLAQDAGREILKVYQNTFHVDYKEDGSPVTIADTTSSQMILQGLKEITPTIPAISEEAQIPSFSERKTWPLFWSIDPLDGTLEFINKRDEFTINIALIEGTKPIFGLIHHPIRQTTYYAQKNGGAFKINKTTTAQLPKIESCIPKDNSLIIAGSRSYPSRKFQHYLQLLQTSFHPVDVIKLGSAYKFCLVAEGSINIYPRFGRTMEWDTAAAQILCNEVGLVLQKENANSELVYNKKNLANPRFLVADPNALQRLFWI